MSRDLFKAVETWSFVVVVVVVQSENLRLRKVGVTLLGLHPYV